MRVLFLLLALMFPLSAVAQESDRGFIQGLLEDALSGEGRTVQIQGFAGALSSRATIEAIRVSDPDGVWLEATDIAMTWNRSALLSRRIAIEEISVGEIDLKRRPLALPGEMPAPEARGIFKLPELPVAVNIDKLDLARVSLGTDILGQSLVLAVTGTASLEGGEGSAEVEVNRLDRDGNISLAGSFANETRVLDFKAAFSEPAGGLVADLIGLPGDPDVDLQISGNGTSSNFDAALTLTTDGAERLGGDFSLRPAEGDATAFALDMEGDITELLAPDLIDTIGERLALLGTGEFSPTTGVSLDQFSITADDISILASGQIAPDGWPETLNLNAEIAPDGDVTEGVYIPGLGGTVRSVDLTGTYDAAQGDSWELTGVAGGVLTDGVQLETVNLSANGRISREDEAVSGKVDLDAVGLELADAALSTALGRQLRAAFGFGWQKGSPLVFEGIDLSGSDYGLTGGIELRNFNSANELTVVPSLKLAAKDLSRFSDIATQTIGGAATLDISGNAKPLTGEFAISLFGATTDLSVGIAEVDPILEGPGQLKLTVERGVDGVRLDPLTIETDHARIEAELNLSSDVGRIVASAKVNDLSRIPSAPQGSLEATLDASLTDGIWAISTDLDIPDTASISYTGSLELPESGGIDVGGQVEIDAGDLGAFAAITGQNISGAANISGTVNYATATGAFAVDATGSGSNLRTGISAVDPLLSGQSNLRAKVSRNADGTFDISEVRLNTPAISADVNGDYDGQDGSVTYDLALANLALIVPDLPGRATLGGTATYQGGRWNISANGTGPGGITLAANGSAKSDFSSVDIDANGAAPLSLANAFLRGQAASGSVTYDLRMRGPLALASLSGDVSLTNGRFAIPSQSFALEDITARIGLGNETAQINVTAAVGDGGTVSVSGPVGLTAPFNADLTGQLDTVTLRVADFLEANLDGGVEISGPLTGRALIDGTINVSRAEMQIPSFPANYQPLEGLEHINTPADVARTLEYAGLGQSATSGGTYPDYRLRVTINAPNQIFVSGRGLDAELGGSLRLSGTTRDIVPIGAFNLIRGRLDLLSRRLELTRGEVSLRGSFNPIINFAATTEVEDVTISIGISGVATSPDLTVDSSPALPQDEALSMFLFGRNVTDISPLQAVQLASAIRTLSGRGGQGLTQNLRDKLGVDDLDVGVNDNNAAQVKLGKYISENVYTDVTVATDGTSQINLNLELNDNTTVRGSVANDGETGIGVFFDKDY